MPKPSGQPRMHDHAQPDRSPRASRPGGPALPGLIALSRNATQRRSRALSMTGAHCGQVRRTTNEPARCVRNDPTHNATSALREDRQSSTNQPLPVDAMRHHNARSDAPDDALQAAQCARAGPRNARAAAIANALPHALQRRIDGGTMRRGGGADNALPALIAASHAQSLRRDCDGGILSLLGFAMRTLQ